MPFLISICLDYCVSILCFSPGSLLGFILFGLVSTMPVGFHIHGCFIQLCYLVYYLVTSNQLFQIFNLGFSKIWHIFICICAKYLILRTYRIISAYLSPLDTFCSLNSNNIIGIKYNLFSGLLYIPFCNTLNAKSIYP